MPRKYSTPAYYKAPLHSRAEITEFLMRPGRSYNNGYGEKSLLTWDVRCYNVDLSFDHLLKIYREGHDVGVEGIDDPFWLALAREKHKQHNMENNLWEWATDDARRSVLDDDTHKMIAYGKGSKLEVSDLGIEWEIYGRSGGHLALTKFEGWDFRDNERDWKNILLGTRLDDGYFMSFMPWPTLYRLYRFVVQSDYDFRPEAIKAELEYQAAWGFFENVCGEKLDDEVKRIREEDRRSKINAGLAGATRSSNAAVPSACC